MGELTDVSTDISSVFFKSAGEDSIVFLLSMKPDVMSESWSCESCFSHNAGGIGNTWQRRINGCPQLSEIAL